MVLDLALLDQTGDLMHWERAVSRALWVAGRLAPDPDHGALIYRPGRLDPRNCSTSAIDSGECTDALVRLLQHARAETLGDSNRELLSSAVERNAETYLVNAVLEKGITNQRLWAAMGLASAWSVFGRDSWREAIGRSVGLALNEQREDGSWGYQPNAVAEGAHPGAADLTVYYHSRCIAFLMHVMTRVPALDCDRLRAAIGRALGFLALVITPDGLKPLSLEGKRWFWDGTYEAGSAAYDVFALLHGATLLDRDELRALGVAAWRQLARHQRSDGAIVACLERGNADFVCPDFHTADLAWTAQLLGELPDLRAASERVSIEHAVARAADAGVVRIDGADRAVLIRTKKRPANSQLGGNVGGGALAAVVGSGGARLLEPGEARCLVYPRPSPARALTGMRAFLRGNRPRREGSQLLFAARLLAGSGRYGAAVRRISDGWLAPLLTSLRDPASTDWATECVEESNTTFRGLVTRHDGGTPRWAAGLAAERRYMLVAAGVRVNFTLSGPAPELGRIEYELPCAARDVQVQSEGLGVERRARCVIATPMRALVRLHVTFDL